MSKITLSHLTNLQNEATAINTLNANSDTIVSSFDNTLSRDGTIPNQMMFNLDMNSKQIINLPAPDTVNSPARLIDVVSNPSLSITNILPLNNTFTGTNKIVLTSDTSWTALGNTALAVANHGNALGIAGFILNDLSPSTFSLPIGTTGYGKVTTDGNTVFGVYGLGELWSTGGGVAVAAEFTSRNFSGHVGSTNLPPDEGIGTAQSVANALQVTCGGTSNSSIGIHIAAEGGSAHVFNTALYMNPLSFAQYGLFIDSQIYGGTPNVTSAVIQNNGVGINLQLNTTGTMVPNNSVIAVFDKFTNPQFSLKQNGTINIVPSTATTAGGAAAPFLTFGSSNIGFFFGSGVPSGLTAPQGSIYFRQDGAAGTAIYLCTVASTTWVAIT